MGSRRQIGPVTAALRAMQEICDEPVELEIQNVHGDIIGSFGIAVMRFKKPTARRRSSVSIGCIHVGAYGCRAELYGTGSGGNLGNFRTAAEAEAALLTHATLQPHPIVLPPAGSAHH